MSFEEQDLPEPTKEEWEAWEKEQEVRAGLRRSEDLEVVKFTGSAEEWEQWHQKQAAKLFPPMPSLPFKDEDEEAKWDQEEAERLEQLVFGQQRSGDKLSTGCLVFFVSWMVAVGILMLKGCGQEAQGQIRGAEKGTARAAMHEDFNRMMGKLIDEDQAPAFPRTMKEDYREWTDNTGRYTTIAKLVKVDGDRVVLQIAPPFDVQRTLHISKLSKPDQDFVRRTKMAAKQGKRVMTADQWLRWGRLLAAELIETDAASMEIPADAKDNEAEAREALRKVAAELRRMSAP